MFYDGIPLGAVQAKVVKPPYFRFLRRMLGSLSDDLVCYYVPRNHRYCLGIWRNRLAGRVHEFQSWSNETELNKAHFNLVRYFLSDYRKKGLIAERKRVWTDDRAMRRGMEERAMAKRDHDAKIKRDFTRDHPIMGAF